MPRIDIDAIAERIGSGYPAPFDQHASISRDTGFDPLIKHMTSKGISCVRLAKIPATTTPTSAPVTPQVAVAKKVATAPKKAAAKNVIVTVEPTAQAKPGVTAAEANTRSRAAEVLKRLGGMSKSRPTRAATLRSSIKAFFKPALNDKQVASVVQSLADSRKIVIDGTKVTYSL